MDNSDALDVRIFRTGHSSCGGGIGSSVRSCQDKEKEREKEKRISVFEKENDLKEKGGPAIGRKEGRKEGNEVRAGREVRWTWMDGWIWVDGHMGEHFRGTGGR